MKISMKISEKFETGFHDTDRLLSIESTGIRSIYAYVTVEGEGHTHEVCVVKAELKAALSVL